MSEIKPIVTFSESSSALAGTPITSCFSQLFANIIHIPVYQRKYCWTKDQWAAFFKDAKHASNHRIGRFIFYPMDKENCKMCVDGQQRVTTTLLLLCSLRNFAMKQNFHDIVLQIHKILFVNVEQGELLMKTQLEPLQEGQVIECCRFIPSFDDRKSFFTAALALPYHFSVESFIDKARVYFDTVVQEEIQSYEQCQNLLNRILNNFIFIEFLLNPSYSGEQASYEALSTINWINSLLMQNNRPGIHLRNVDLIRNYVVAKKEFFAWAKFEEVFGKPMDMDMAENCLEEFIKEKLKDPKPVQLLPVFTLYGHFLQCVELEPNIAKLVHEMTAKAKQVLQSGKVIIAKKQNNELFPKPKFK